MNFFTGFYDELTKLGATIPASKWLSLRALGNTLGFGMLGAGAGAVAGGEDNRLRGAALGALTLGGYKGGASLLQRRKILSKMKKSPAYRRRVEKLVKEKQKSMNGRSKR